MNGSLLRKTYLWWRLLHGTTTHSKNARVYMGYYSHEKEKWSSRVLASSGAAKRYLERRPVRHGGEWMAVEGLRWVKERAEKLPTGTSRHPCYPTPTTCPCAETGRRRARSKREKERKRERERERERQREGWNEDAERQCKVWASAVSRYIFFRLKQFFCSFLAIHHDSLAFPPHRKPSPHPFVLPSRDNCLRFSPFPPLGRPFP